MNDEKAKFTWHYYVMALGALGAMLAATLGASGGIVSGLALAIISHPRIPFKTLTRVFFMVLFMILYVFAFPEPEVVRALMAENQ
ncbi:MAG: hypothetical protein GXO35_07760 [Gammaproteobacteria bacterium]|nr:hypothetical protein [Gammaproteobacteria bacterium]